MDSSYSPPTGKTSVQAPICRIKFIRLQYPSWAGTLNWCSALVHNDMLQNYIVLNTGSCPWPSQTTCLSSPVLSTLWQGPAILHNTQTLSLGLGTDSACPVQMSSICMQFAEAIDFFSSQASFISSALLIHVHAYWYTANKQWWSYHMH